MSQHSHRARWSGRCPRLEAAGIDREPFAAAAAPTSRRWSGRCPRLREPRIFFVLFAAVSRSYDSRARRIPKSVAGMVRE